MINHEKTRLFIFAFLAFCVLSSKNILIYNEETLVALSFLAFVVFIFYYFGETIKNSLNERSELIQAELSNFLTIKQDSLKELLSEHRKVLNLKKSFTLLKEFTTEELKTLSMQGETLVSFQLPNQFKQKLTNLALGKTSLQQKIQEIMSSNLMAAVLINFKKNKKSNKKRKQSPSFAKQLLNF